MIIPNIWKNKKCSKPPISNGLCNCENSRGFPRWVGNRNSGGNSISIHVHIYHCILVVEICSPSWSIMYKFNLNNSGMYTIIIWHAYTIDYWQVHHHPNYSCTIYIQSHSYNSFNKGGKAALFVFSDNMNSPRAQRPDFFALGELGEVELSLAKGLITLAVGKLVELTNLWIYSVYFRHAYYIYVYICYKPEANYIVGGHFL